MPFRVPERQTEIELGEEEILYTRDPVEVLQMLPRRRACVVFLLNPPRIEQVVGIDGSRWDNGCDPNHVEPNASLRSLSEPRRRHLGEYADSRRRDGRQGLRASVAHRQPNGSR